MAFQLVNQTQQRLYGIDEEALSSQRLTATLERFGVQRASRVEVNFSSLESFENPEASKVIIRVKQPDQTERSVVCMIELKGTIDRILAENGFVLDEDETWKAIYVFTRPVGSQK